MTVYWNCLGNSFQYDDEMVVTYNRNIQTLKNVPKFFTTPGMMAADPYAIRHYRPLVVLSYALNYAAGGLNPVGYHLVNIAIHVGSAFMIFMIVQAILGDMGHGAWGVGGMSGVREQGSGGFLTPPFVASLAAGLVFLVHPFNSEAVNYITARSSVMSGFFYLLAFYFWVKFRSSADLHSRLIVGDEPQRYIYYLSSLLAFVAGMLSKEVAVTLPMVLLLYDLYFGGRRLKPASASAAQLRTPHSALRHLIHWRTYIPYLPFVLIVVVPYLLVRFFSYGEVFPSFQRDLITQFQTEIPVLVKHLRMFLFPSPLSPFHTVDIQRTLSFSVIYSTLIMFVYVAVAVLLYRISFHPLRVVSFFMVWFLIVLLPTTIIPLNAIFQENRGYLAIVSFAVMSGIILGTIQLTKLGKISFAILAVLLIIYTGVTVKQNRVWKDEMTLWSNVLKKYPRSPEAYTALGIAYKRAGMYNQAIDAFRKSTVLGGKGNFFVHDNLGWIYMEQEKLDMAMKELEMAINLYSYKPQTHNNLGIVYSRRGKLELAEREFRTATLLDPGYSEAYLNLGFIYMQQERLKEAVNAYQKGLSISPGHVKQRFYLGLLYETLGMKEDAFDCYRLVIQQAGKDEEILVREARSHLEKMGK